MSLILGVIMLNFIMLNVFMQIAITLSVVILIVVAAHLNLTLESKFIELVDNCMSLHSGKLIAVIVSFKSNKIKMEFVVVQ
jgi:hypothetical protein